MIFVFSDPHAMDVFGAFSFGFLIGFGLAIFGFWLSKR